MLYTHGSMDNTPLEKADVVLFGIPFDSSETQRQTKFGPMFFRSFLHDLEGFDLETGIDFWEAIKFCDAGDIDVVEGSHELTAERICDTVRSIMSKNPGALPVFIGGDHSVTWPIVKSMQEIANKKFTVIQFDAHPDLYPEWKGFKHSHASFSHHIINDPNFELVQIGVRCINSVELEAWKSVKKVIEKTGNPVYLTIDLDVLDPAHAKSVATPEPGGMDFGELCSHLRKACRNRIVGFDIVECASRSVDDDSHITACNIMKKILGYIWMEKK